MLQGVMKSGKGGSRKDRLVFREPIPRGLKPAPE